MAKFIAFIILLYLSTTSAGLLPLIKRSGLIRTIKNFKSVPLKTITGLQEFTQYANRARKGNTNYNSEFPPIFVLLRANEALNNDRSDENLFDYDRLNNGQEMSPNKMQLISRKLKEELHDTSDNIVVLVVDNSGRHAKKGRINKKHKNSLINLLANEYNNDDRLNNEQELSEKIIKSISRMPKGKAELDDLGDMSDTVMLVDNSDREAKRDRVEEIGNSPVNTVLNEELNDLFDEKGRIFLSKPKDFEQRKLNKLLDKAVSYTTDKKQLRSPTETFSANEVEKLKVILRAMKDSGESEDPKSVYEFSDLVL